MTYTSVIFITSDKKWSVDRTKVRALKNDIFLLISGGQSLVSLIKAVVQGRAAFVPQATHFSFTSSALGPLLLPWFVCLVVESR